MSVPIATRLHDLYRAASRGFIDTQTDSQPPPLDMVQRLRDELDRLRDQNQRLDQMVARFRGLYEEQTIIVAKLRRRPNP